MVPVWKLDGSVRLCIDYRKLNSVTYPDPHAIPLIEDLLDTLGNASYLTKLDLNKGLYQIQMAADDIDKTAFCSPWRKFAFLHTHALWASKFPIYLPAAHASGSELIVRVHRSLH